MQMVLLWIALAMSFIAGVEFVILCEYRKKYRRIKEKAVAREIQGRENRERIVKEISKCDM